MIATKRGFVDVVNALLQDENDAVNITTSRGDNIISKTFFFFIRTSFLNG